jgi:hypothetical protein
MTLIRKLLAVFEMLEKDCLSPDNNEHSSQGGSETALHNLLTPAFRRQHDTCCALRVATLHGLRALATCRCGKLRRRKAGVSNLQQQSATRIYFRIERKEG